MVGGIKPECIRSRSGANNIDQDPPPSRFAVFAVDLGRNPDDKNRSLKIFYLAGRKFKA